MNSESDESDRLHCCDTTPAYPERRSIPKSASLPQVMGLSQNNLIQTPLLDVHNHLSKQHHTRHVCDSGFSEWSPAASSQESLQDTPSLHSSFSGSSSALSPLATPHATPSEFSPKHHRRSWPLKSRKLSFISPAVENSSDNSFATSTQDAKDDIPSQSSCRSRSTSRSPLPSTSDEFENSFQEMSLEDSSSDSAQHSPLPLSSSSPVFAFSRQQSLQDRLQPPQRELKQLNLPSIAQKDVTQSTNPDDSLLPKVEPYSDSPVKRIHHDLAAFHSSSPLVILANEPDRTLCQKDSLSVESHSSIPVMTLEKKSKVEPNVDADSCCIQTSNADSFKSPVKRCSALESPSSSPTLVSPVKMRRLRGKSCRKAEVKVLKRDLFSSGSTTKVDSTSLPSLNRGKDLQCLRSFDDERVPQFLSFDNQFRQETPKRFDYLSLHRRSSSFNKNADELVERVCRMFSPANPQQLIGRYIGEQKFDILGNLWRRNMTGCLEQIFEYLPDCDLIRVVDVCPDWKLALLGETRAFRRLRAFQRQNSPRKNRTHDSKENLSTKPLDLSACPMTVSRGLLTDVQPQTISQSQAEVSSSQALQSPSLQSEDLARNCPHCQSQAVIQPCQDRAICLAEKCLYDFCTKCFFPFHHPSPCKPLVHSASRAAVAGTKKSRRSLKRLKNL